MKPWDDIVLTEEEKEAAIVEGKKRKYFFEKNREYWESQEYAVSSVGRAPVSKTGGGGSNPSRRAIKDEKELI